MPGIMPFHNYAKIAQFAARDGIEIPRWVALKMEGYMDDVADPRLWLDASRNAVRNRFNGRMGAPGIQFLHDELSADAGAVPAPAAGRSPRLRYAVSTASRPKRYVVRLGLQPSARSRAKPTPTVAGCAAARPA